MRTGETGVRIGVNGRNTGVTRSITAAHAVAASTSETDERTAGTAWKIGAIVARIGATGERIVGIGVRKGASER